MEPSRSLFVHSFRNKYDRSGRSTGFAFVTYENEEDAAAAQKELDGVLAKGAFRPVGGDAIWATAYSLLGVAGEEIHVKLDHYYAPRNAKDKPSGTTSSAKGGRGGSLLNRIAKESLLNRLGDKEGGKDDSKATT